MSLEDIARKTKEFLFSRQRAYKMTFGLENIQVKTVMADLEIFCRAKNSTFDPDARVQALLEGRREVFLRIQDHLNLSSDKLWTKYGKGN